MKRYTVAQLEAFARIAECGSFRVAAERLAITQPTISLRIRDLEAAVGQPLFARGRGGVRLTETGQTVLQYVRRGLSVFEEMELRLASDDPLSGVLRLGSSNTFALSCLPELVRALESRQPRLNVELTISNSTTLGMLLAARKLDVAFLVDTPVPPHIRIEPLAFCEIGWFAGAASRGGRRALRPRDIARRRIITLPPPSPFHTIIAAWFAQAGTPLPPLSTCNDMATIVRLLKTGVAIGVLPICIIDIELQAETILPLRASPALEPLTICAAYQASMRGHSSEIILRVARDAVFRAGAGLTPLHAPVTR